MFNRPQRTEYSAGNRLKTARIDVLSKHGILVDSRLMVPIARHVGYSQILARMN
jgi:hypothetical protein